MSTSHPKATRRTLRKKKSVSKKFLAESLEPRCLLAAPDFGFLPDSFPIRAGTALNIPLSSIDADGDGVTFAASIDNPLFEASVPQGNRSVRFSLTHASSGLPGDVSFTDDFTFELLEGIAPKTTQKFRELVESGAYDNLTFFRLVNNFAAQFGDPNLVGTGGSGVSIDDEFSKFSRHTSSGLISTAKSLDDTFDQQAFITLGDINSTRNLDFQHVVFGAITSFGNDITFNIPVGPNPVTPDTNFPASPIVIESSSVFVDNKNGVLRLFVPDNVAPGTIANLTLTVTDDNGESTTKIVPVEVFADNFDDQPYLTPDPPPQVANLGETVNFTLHASDIEGDPFEFLEGSASDYAQRGLFKNPNLQVDVNPSTGDVTVTPTGPVSGTNAVLVKVKQIGNTTGAEDFQLVPISYRMPAPLGVVLLSDSGVPNDGITAVNNTSGIPIELRVDGVVAGATVQLLINGDPSEQNIAPADGSFVFTFDGTSIIADGDYVVTARFVSVDSLPFGNFDPLVISGEETAPLAVTIDTRPIIFTSSPNTAATPAVPYTYNVESDREGEPGLFYELAQAPAGMTIDPTTGLIQWTPSVAQAGDNAVTVRAVDLAGNADQQSFTILTNTHPLLINVGNQTIDEGMLLDVLLTVEDPDAGETFTFGLVGAVPDGAAIDNTGRFTFTPTEAQGPGSFEITARVTDSRGAFDEMMFTVQVDEVQQAPVLDAVEDQLVLAGTSISLDIVGFDPDIPQRPLTFSLDPGAPAGAAIDPVLGLFTFSVPAGASLGMLPVTVRATEGSGADELSTTTTFNLIVVDNLPPIFPDQTTEFTVKASDPLSFDAMAIDPDPVPVDLLYSLEPGAPEFVTIDPATGRVTVSTTRETPPQILNIVVRATEIGLDALTVTETFSVDITDPPNIPPVFPEQPMSFTTQASVPLSFDVTAIDPTPGAVPLVFSLEPGVPEFVAIDSTTGEVTVTTERLTPLQTVDVVVRVTEVGPDALFATKTFTVELTSPPNVPPAFPNQPMSFTTAASVPLSFDATAIDPAPGASPLTFSLEPGVPEFVTIDSATGKVTVTTTRQTPLQMFDVIVHATEIGPDAFTATKTFTVQITAPPNLPPVFPEQPMSFTTQASVPLSFDVTAIDPTPGAVPLVFSLEPGVPEFVAIDSTTGEVTVTADRLTPLHTVDVVVRVTEIRADALFATKTFTVELTSPPNVPPAFLAQPTEFTSEVGSPLSFDVAVIDPAPGAVPLAFSLEPGAASIVSIDAASGRLTVSSTTETLPQTIQFVVRATEIGPDALSATQAFTVNLVPVSNKNPVFSPVAKHSVRRGLEVKFGAEAIDPDTPPSPLVFHLADGAPSEASIDPRTGEVTFRSTATTTVGLHRFGIEVSEAVPGGLSAATAVEVEVLPTGFRAFVGIGDSRFGPDPADLLPATERTPTFATIVGQFANTASPTNASATNPIPPQGATDGFPNIPFNNITYGADTGVGRGFKQETNQPDDDSKDKSPEEENTNSVVPSQATEPVEDTKEKNPEGDASTHDDDEDGNNATPTATLWDDRLIDWATTEHWAPGHESLARSMNASVNRSRRAIDNTDPYDIDLEPLLVQPLAARSASGSETDERLRTDFSRSSSATVVLPAPASKETVETPVVAEPPVSQEVSEEVATVAAAGVALYMPLLVTNLPEAKQSKGRWRHWLQDGRQG